MTTFLESWRRDIDRAQREAERGAKLAAEQLARAMRGEAPCVRPLPGGVLHATTEPTGAERAEAVRRAVFAAIATEGVTVTMETAERLARRVAQELDARP